MKIYERIDEEFEEVAQVTPEGEVNGDSSTAEALREDIENGWIEDPEGEPVKEGGQLLLEIQHRYPAGYYDVEFEEGDLKEAYKIDSKDNDGEESTGN